MRVGWSGGSRDLTLRGSVTRFLPSDYAIPLSTVSKSHLALATKFSVFDDSLDEKKH